jgi:hypothetical protein
MTPYRSLIEAAAQARDLDPNLIEGADSAGVVRQHLLVEPGTSLSLSVERRDASTVPAADVCRARVRGTADRLSVPERGSRSGVVGATGVVGPDADHGRDGTRRKLPRSVSHAALRSGNEPARSAAACSRNCCCGQPGTCGWRSRPTTPGSAGRRARRGSGMRPPSWCSIDRSKWRIRR